ncbi:TetR/AcrR family transcriptional regulator [Embleya sp. NPDC056575]|uniref:TetR/AcrR family transcriptional regulator n=1 Tax=unclassified Embleya TaxID=2699296 RepID=UPI003697D16D
MPPINEARRRGLADAAIALLASGGVHGLTHRSVEKTAKVPSGTASNYFPTREALLVGAAERVVELHLADMESASRGEAMPQAVDEPGSMPSSAREGRRDTATAARLVDLLTASLLNAATRQRDRYRAICELRLEAARWPALASALAGLTELTQAQTESLHADLGTRLPASAIRTLITLYSGTLFTLVTTPLAEIEEAAVRDLVEASVRGVVGEPGPS